MSGTLDVRVAHPEADAKVSFIQKKHLKLVWEGIKKTLNKYTNLK